MENYSLFMGAAAVMKMAVEMAAVSMEKPSGHSRPGGRTPVPRSRLRDGGGYGRKRTPDEAEELLAKISKNHDDWSTPEPTPTPILKKRGMIELNDEDMREAKKSLMEKGIKSEDVKNLPPIEDLCKIIPPSSTIEYMKDIVSNKRKIPNEDISTMLANYSFNGKVPKKLGDPDKLIPTDISLQRADKSTAVPVGVCEDVIRAKHTSVGNPKWKV
ncbi:hypothetical protein QYE76_016006 [Lolium multiflorum]|uniref:Uncharacterized protein n=1 Tax=Lolium multiflorum TaxID=4521 RepID=A0AAD8U7L4_LOLMU|nr:hypothetical protein QYE76_016006 [Lolium multiflorum]